MARQRYVDSALWLRGKMMEENEIAKQQRRLATVFLLLSLPLSYWSWFFTVAFLNFRDEYYLRMETAGQSITHELILRDVGQDCLLILIILCFAIGLPLFVLSLKKKWKPNCWRYWILLFLSCLWLSNFGSIVAIVPYLSRHNILPELPQVWLEKNS